MSNPSITNIVLNGSIEDLEEIDINKSLTINGNMNTLSGKINVSGNNVKIKNVTLNNKVNVSGNDVTLDTITVDSFKSSQTDMKQPPFERMIEVSGDNFTIKNSTIRGTEDTSSNGVFRNAIWIDDKAGENIVLDNNNFESLNNVYNAVEFGQNYKVGENVKIIGNTFDAELAHNSISFYKFVEGANVTLKNNHIAYMRISNYDNVAAYITFEGGQAEFSEADKASPDDLAFLTAEIVSDSDSFEDMIIFIDGFKDGEGKEYTEDGTGLGKFIEYWDDVKKTYDIDAGKKPIVTYNGHK